MSPTTRPTAAQLLSAGGGTPLPAPVLQRMERAFGTGFGRVRIHRGDEADAFDAEAFTAGEKVFLPRDAPPVTSARGQSLLAHELTHVLQQRSGRVRNRGPGISVDPHPGLEREAEAAGQAIARGEAPAVGSHAGAASAGSAAAPAAGVVQRRRGKASKSARKRRLAESSPEAVAKRRERAERREAAAKDADALGGEDFSLGDALKVAEESKLPEGLGASAPAEPQKPKEKAKPAGPSKRQQRRERAAMKRRLRAVGNLLGSGQGSGNPTLQDSNNQLLQGLAGAAGDAKQAEAQAMAVPPAPEPTEEWAQPQALGDPTSPPPLPIPELPQPESPASIQPDPPPSPLTAAVPTKSYKEFHKEVSDAFGSAPDKPVQKKSRGKGKGR